ncbi:hypothetical protein LX97_01090 [Nonlabens dokdonensis]|jgi:hypothetical protein|uniref:Uncharacterized protein n=2 Tax=Nonlabens dokdonensis TaxID=328515 RepID=L7WC17_NONDD|nr:hypothetical protein [Nonlabens dokdonensis]AGC76423.1 hypothetical protein DDD_1296 [Nonlabens dokdonensis DSW-6]PZX44081.1 hypothetical protein LX97_01090 [Nonlabens dokdonensis]
MNNLKKFTLPLFFVFGIALAATATQTTYENAPESTSIDKHLVTCQNSSCSYKGHPRNKIKELKPFQNIVE